MSKHTPGPWQFDELVRLDDGLGYISADGKDICHAGVTDLPADENRANARLIAAAPDLLEALRALVDQLADMRRPGVGTIVLGRAEAAIAKAEATS